MQIQYKTNRLRITRLQRTDLNALNQLLSDPIIRDLSGLQLPADNAQRLLALSMVTPEPYIFVLKLVGTDELIGMFGFYQCYRADFMISAHYRELGYLLGQKWWGNGYVAEAGNKLISDFFATTQYRYLCAGVMANNHRSQRVLTKLGLKQTSHPTELAASQFNDLEQYYQRDSLMMST
ncbi:GNAT family N-acetyltransferase [Paucilactobacillus wasatchensis]|uniref:N-acetyltransferase domain-containing protein n=1 Tax=Paucilactobacillus wasatchensis TaxID=1335616 RepID=A0A0D1A7S4_9LACO|nr:GNAT family N-acetyltransferase [Paucilactobacillus wasatchensis]KIS02796.1 hypothetical protein WDC_1627 [Paucilactobacillus wasatchensis]